MRYLLDTDHLSELIKDEQDPVFRHKLECGDKQHWQLVTTIVNVGEVVRGINMSMGLLRDRLEANLFEILQLVEILTVTKEAADRYVELRQQLISEARPIKEPDYFIAAVALVERRCLVTKDIGHFGRVRGLQLECWKS